MSIDITDYQALARRQRGYQREVTDILTGLREDEPETQNAHVLRATRANLELLARQFSVNHSDMIDHEEAVEDQLAAAAKAFRVAQTSATAIVDEKLENVRRINTPSNLISLKADMDAIMLGYEELQAFTIECSPDCVNASEIRVRLKDLSALLDQYTLTWKKIYALEDEDRKETMKAEQKAFKTDYYLTLSWFDNKLPARSSSQPPPGRSSHESCVKLPKIELQKFDGAPDNWISFRDSFKSLVHNVVSLSGAIKFRYLKMSITDRHSPIKHLLETDDGYTAAWEAVLDYYDDNRRIVDCHFSSMLKMKSMEQESHDELQRVLNDFVLHTASLTRMFSDAELYQALIAHLVIQRLDPHTRDLWETENKGSVPFWPHLETFLKERRKTLSTMPASKSSSSPKLTKPGSKPSWRTSNVNTSTTRSAPGESRSQPRKPLKCLMCKCDHRVFACNQFINMSIPARLAKVKEWKVCANCFGSHPIDACKSTYRCRSCQQRHNTMLHMEQQPTPSLFNTASAHALQAPQSELQASAASFYFPASSCNTASCHTDKVTLLQTAIVQIKDANGEWHNARAFLDSGSDSNFISKSVAQALKLKMEPTYIEAKGLGGNRAAVIKHKLRAEVGTMDENFTMEFLVTSKVTNPSPIVPVGAQHLGIPINLPLADPSFSTPGQIDILIGNEFYGDLIREGRIKLPSGPTLLNTIFGWIFCGSLPQAATHRISVQCHHNTLAELKESVERFYKLEDYRNTKRFLTDEEAHCEKVFEQTHVRLPNGRFSITLPLKSNIDQLGNNYRSAMCQFLASERRLQKNEPVRLKYDAFMKEYEALGHMSEIDISHELPNAPSFYFPHHAVENPDSSTTKLRVVCNGSARTSTGLSFNDTQCIGPQVQSDAFTLSLRFRKYPIVIKADIEKMYRQVEVVEHQRKYQRLLYRSSPHEKIKVFNINTLVYGTRSASFQATRCLKELSIVNRDKFPEAAEDILNGFYVDDYISGVKEAVDKASNVTNILSSAQMKLRKFSSNNADFLKSVPEDSREKLHPDKLLKALGISWNPEADTIQFDIKPIRFEKITRRTILSELCRIYDPEGLLGPVTFLFKKFLKKIFKLAMPWDAPVPSKEAEEWTEIASTFPQLEQIRLPRCVVIESATNIQLHGFCDASDAGYGASIYVVSHDAAGRTMSRLVCAKSRIAPNEYRSTARLELCGIVLLANLMKQVAEALNLPFSRKVCWSDSAIALQWLKKCPTQLQEFVANRVSESQEISTALDLTWRHVRGLLNPADLISRGLTPLEIITCTLWWNGPEFLRMPEDKWPPSIVEVDPNEPTFAQEFKKVETLVHAIKAQQVPAATANPFLEIIESSSRTFPAKWKIAHVMRFIHNARASKFSKKRRTGPIDVDDILDAELAFARIYQAQHFRDDFHRCADGKAVPANSRIKNLQPIWDPSCRLMRVGGRLNFAETCSEDQKHPILLPVCHFARLIVRETHQKNLHAGNNATKSFVRMRYWPVDAKKLVWKEVHTCIKCFRARPRMAQQLMGQLPADRISPAPAFYNTGVDYCGPFDIKISKMRTAKTGKAYVALFVCLATKAIHMEIVTDLTTQAFLAAFDKFVSRRGLPRTIRSDNGLNFVGANNELRELYEFLANDTTQQDVRRHLAEQEIQWKFNPPRAPAQGGLWEAGVKSMKHHFKRVAQNALLTFEEFDRLKSKIEAILNSRPLTALSNDPSDLSALTAGHFLIGRPLTAKPDRDLTQVSINRLQRWDRVVQMQQQFWKRWSREYLHQLQVRTKNYKNIVPVTVGQLVLIHLDNCPSMFWPLGRITNIYPGRDGITRVASIKTANSTYERPVDKLALLPIAPEEDEQPEAPEDVRD